jgi:hypothetical protein
VGERGRLCAGRNAPFPRGTTTTSQYIEIDMAMKRKVLERCPGPVAVPNDDGR